MAWTNVNQEGDMTLSQLEGLLPAPDGGKAGDARARGWVAWLRGDSLEIFGLHDFGPGEPDGSHCRGTAPGATRQRTEATTTPLPRR